MKKVLCILLCCLFTVGLLPVTAHAAEVTGTSDGWAYCGGTFDMRATISEGADRATYQWQVDASFGDGSWYDLDESTGIYGYHGTKTDNLQFATPPQDNTYEYGTGWEDIPFRCKVTLDGSTYYTQPMYMNFESYASFKGAVSNAGYGLKEPVISGVQSLSGSGKQYTGTVSAGQELWISADCVPVTNAVMMTSELIFTPEIWITENGKTTHSGRTIRYTPSKVGSEVKIEIRLPMKLGVNDMGCYDTKSVTFTVQEPKSVGTGTVKQEGSLLKNMYNEAEKLIRVPKGSAVSVVEEMGSWYKVSYGGYVGYVPSTSVTLSKPLIQQTVSEVSVSIADPAIGDAPQYNPPVNTEGCELYLIEPVSWIDNETNRFMKPGEKFQEGHSYTVQIWVAAKEGYEFPVDAYGNIQVKGNIGTYKASVGKAYEQDPSRVISLSYKYGALVKIHTCKVSLVKQVEPTCQKPGRKAYFRCECGMCYADARATQVIDGNSWGVMPAVDHKPETVWKYNGTHHYKKCVWCQQVCAKTTEKHSGGSATCMEKAKCSVCGALYGETGEKHRWEKEFTYKTADGHAAVCADCKVHGELKKHTPGSAATETQPQLCRDCGYVLAPAKNHVHQLTRVEKTPATCTHPGNIEYYTCSGCSQLFEDAAGKKSLPADTDVTVPCTGHTAADGWQTDEELHWRLCDVCGEVLEETRMFHEFEEGECSTCGIAAAVSGDEGSEQGKDKPQLTPEEILDPEQRNESGGGSLSPAGASSFKVIALTVVCSAAIAALVTALIIDKKKSGSKK
ncbi:MAG: SH3 domain-containing protein [Oscillospiraceae bacterium]|nr:SH3 domain-containing protein [Oscillospiraceae bacterium]